MRSTTYASKYLDPVNGTLLGAVPGNRRRYDVAGALSYLVRQLRNGYSPAVAHASMPPWMMTHVAQAAAMNDPGIATDFELVDSL